MLIDTVDYTLQVCRMKFSFILILIELFHHAFLTILFLQRAQALSFIGPE